MKPVLTFWTTLYIPLVSQIGDMVTLFSEVNGWRNKLGVWVSECLCE